MSQDTTPGVKRIHPVYGLIAFLAFVACFVPLGASAGAPGLQVNPLQYEDNLTGQPKSGHIDVANPTDSKVVINTAVRGFRQQGTHGDLSFYDDADLAQAIQVDLKSFELGPREAVRVLFSVDPAKLPKGGVYAAIFFSTQPDDKPGNSSYVAQSANVGTLLMLRNGGDAAAHGSITKLDLPLWQFGNGLYGSATVTNTSAPQGGVAFRPNLEARVFPWGKAAKQPTGLILPGVTREFGVRRAGSFLGLLPVTLRDSQTHSSRTAWVIACTGYYSWGLLVVFLAMLVVGVLWLVRLKRPRLAASAAPDPIVSIPVVSEPEPEPEPEPEKPQPTKIKLSVEEAPKPKPKPRPRSKPHRPDPQLRRATDISPRRPSI